MSQPFSYPVDDKSFAPSSIANVLQTFGFNSVDQHLKVTVNNPLNKSYSLGGALHVVCQDTKRYVYVYDQSFPLEGITIPRTRSDYSLLDMALPDTVLFTPSTLELNDWCFNLPANMDQEIRSSGTAEFAFNNEFSCHIAAGENAEIPLAMFGMSKMSFKFGLPVASYKFKEVEASFVLENTLPLQVTLTDIQWILLLAVVSSSLPVGALAAKNKELTAQKDQEESREKAKTALANRKAEAFTGTGDQEIQVKSGYRTIHLPLTWDKDQYVPEALYLPQRSVLVNLLKQSQRS